MRRIAHLSDLHFGRTDHRVTESLLEDLYAQRPDLVIISGDLTQRARSHQFAEARDFLDRLPAVPLVVPGNHDLAPLYRPLKRLFSPRAKFQAHLPGHKEWPIWQDDEVLAVGLDSTRHLRWISGKLRSSHLDHIDNVVATAEPNACKVVFLHHPPSTAASGHPFETLAERGIDVVLTGHVHKAHVEVIEGSDHVSCVLVQASTACSTRLREDANGYCLLDVEMPHLAVTVQGWNGDRFHPHRHFSFEKVRNQWRKSHA